MMTVNSNYVFFIILLILIVQLTRFNLFSGRNDEFEESPVGQLAFEKEKYVVPISSETLPQELSAELLRSSPTLDESKLDQQIKNRFDKRVEIMKRACSVWV